MALVASWEVLAVDDVGPGCCVGTRLYRVSTVATLHDGTMTPAQVDVSMSPAALEAWMGAVGSKPVTP